MPIDRLTNNPLWRICTISRATSSPVFFEYKNRAKSTILLNFSPFIAVIIKPSLRPASWAGESLSICVITKPSVELKSESLRLLWLQRNEQRPRSGFRRFQIENVTGIEDAQEAYSCQLRNEFITRQEWLEEFRLGKWSITWKNLVIKKQYRNSRWSSDSKC